jgi:hypothetical protein
MGLKYFERLASNNLLPVNMCHSNYLNDSHYSINFH